MFICNNIYFLKKVNNIYFNVCLSIFFAYDYVYDFDKKISFCKIKKLGLWSVPINKALGNRQRIDIIKEKDNKTKQIEKEVT